MSCPIHGRLPVLWLVGLLAMGLPLAAATPPWVVRTWQSDEGLPDNTVVGMEQTPDGFLWVATRTGLVRFDGMRFQPFQMTAAGAPAGGIKALVADRRGRLWVAKDDGVVVCVDQGVATMVVGPEFSGGYADSGERIMAIDAEDAVWVCYSGGLVLRLRDGQVRSFTETDGLPGGSACRLTMDGTGQLWFAQGDWVGVFRDGRFCPLAQQSFQRITGAHGAGGIWGYRDRQVWKLAEGGAPVKLGALPDDVPEVGPTAMRQDRAGCLWLGTTKAGLFRFDPAGGVTAPLPQQTIWALQEDREGNLWVGTRGGGLNQLKPRVVELLTTGSATPFEPVQSLCQDTDGMLWAIVWPDGRLVRSAGQTWSPLALEDGRSISRSECVAADPLGGVWIGTSEAGVLHWQGGAVTETLDLTNGLAGNDVGALLVSASGEVWIGPRFVEVVQCRKNGQLRTFQMPAGGGSVMALALDAAGDCWVATFGRRLLRVHGEVVTDETAATLAEPCEIRGLLGTADGSLWIGYAGQGLGRLKAGRFSQWRSGQGLPDDYICNILPDGRGRLWFAGNRGIFSVRKTDFDDFEAGRITRVCAVAYGRNDGLLRLQANFNLWPGAQRGTDGRLLFAMQSGIAAVSADNLQQHPPPPVVIECVTANGQTVAAYQAGRRPEPPRAGVPLELGRAGTHLHLPPGQHRVEFAFTALTFTKPEAIGFRYRLHPVDEDWVDAGTLRTATYAQIPPGHYQFEVSACSNEGVWNPAGAALDLTAEPYWWETAWFRVLGPLATAGLLGWGILAGVRRRHRRQIERLELQQATARERARIAADLHDDLGARLTELSLLGSLGVRPAIPLAQAQDYLGEVATKSREMVAALDEIVWAVKPENDLMPSVISYLCHYAQRFFETTPIHCRLDVATGLADLSFNSEQRHGLLLALKEALSNVVRHSAATVVWLRIFVRHGMLHVVVEDNGQGIPGTDPAAGADGLANMCGRLAGMGGTCDVRSAPGQGTSVEFALPLAGTSAK